MKFKKLITSGLAVLMGVTSQFAIQPALAADLELKMQFASPDGTSWNIMDRRFAADLETAFGGRAKVVFFPPNSVTSIEDLLQSVGSGLLDIGFVWHPTLEDQFPQMELFRLPGLTKNQTLATVVYWRLKEQFPIMEGLFADDDNVVEIATFIAMGSHLHSKEPIRKLADLKGKVIAYSNYAGFAVLEKLGASPSTIGGSDAYLALQRGEIDGVIAPWDWVNNLKLNEVTEYHTLLNISPNTYSTVMNKDTYNKFTDEEKLHIKNMVLMHYFYNSINSAAAATKDIPADKILSLSEADQVELTSKMQPLWGEWVRNAEARGVPGQKILDETVRLLKLYDQN